MTTNEATMMGFGGLTAKRFAGKPLRQPSYSMREVRRCEKDLSRSRVHYVTERAHFQDALGEMVLLCNEVMRRQADFGENSRNKSNKKTPKKKKRTTKPLSLEYMADRLDVDDPIFGFIIRSSSDNHEKSLNDNIDGDMEKQKTAKEMSMMQGFISVTTFTNWQKTFRWDSMHDSAFSYDDKHTAQLMAKGERLYDVDGSLASQLESTVRCGDPWNEGIVWPRIAEISLLGALGCGKALINLAIEKLESMPPTSKANYDFVVLQATENSISFYESMGFVRVGCITENDELEEQHVQKQKNNDESHNNQQNKKNYKDSCSSLSQTDDAKDNQVPSTESLPSNDNSNNVNDEPVIVSSSVSTYITSKEKEMPNDIAKKFNVSVWDVIFLNHFMYPDIVPRSWLLKDTHIFIPNEKTANNAVSNILHFEKNIQKAFDNTAATKWYYCEDDESPRDIAKKFGVNCRDLVKANKRRIADLQANSRLIERTKIQITNLDIHPDKHIPYCHWTFPDDKFEDNEPSYMMVRKLNRSPKLGRSKSPNNFSLSLSIKVENYVPPNSNPTKTSQSKNKKNCISQYESKTKLKKRKLHPKQPIPPKRPMTAYFRFMNEIRNSLNNSDQREVARISSERWKMLPGIEKSKYQELSNKAHAEYKEAIQKFKQDMIEFSRSYPDWANYHDKDICSKPIRKIKNGSIQRNLFNKVVKLNTDGIREAGTEFKYYYVLTFLPDLQWCHLAPMRKVGVYGQDKPKSFGRPIWMLVSEDEGKELDITSTFCEIVRSRATRGCPNADHEQWDILNDMIPLAPIFTRNACGGLSKSLSPRRPIESDTINSQSKINPSKTNREESGNDHEVSSSHTKSESPNLNSSTANDQPLNEDNESHSHMKGSKNLSEPVKHIDASKTVLINEDVELKKFHNYLASEL